MYFLFLQTLSSNEKLQKHRLVLGIANWLPIFFVGAFYGTLVIRFLVVCLQSIVRAAKAKSLVLFLRRSHHMMFYVYGIVLILCWYFWQMLSFFLFWCNSALYISGTYTLKLILFAVWIIFCIFEWKKINKFVIIISFVLSSTWINLIFNLYISTPFISSYSKSLSEIISHDE